jgi:hypothetical protein
MGDGRYLGEGCFFPVSRKKERDDKWLVGLRNCIAWMKKKLKS